MKIPETSIRKVKINEIGILDFDRKLNPKQVNVINKSVLDHGILRLPVLVETKIITGKLAYFSVDGKHLQNCLMRNNIKETDCMIKVTNDIHEIVKIMSDLNNAQLAWTTENYVHAYRALKMTDYNELYLHVLANGFTYNVSAKILGSTHGVKKGMFKANNTDAEELTNCLIDVTNLLRTTSAKFMFAYINFFRSSTKKVYDHKLMMRKLAIFKKNIQLSDDHKVMTEMLENIYKK
jgi:hypothetical protein